jgi:tRNA threonylcarbamoyladenosine biosynthesis protein TsaE
VLVVETSGPAETEALGGELAGGLRAGDVVLVRGELGAGKTTLVRGAARALGVSDPVTSPTFAIGHRYRGAGVMVAHLDLYRLASLAREDPGLLEDYLGPDRIAFVEWPEIGGAELARAALRVTLTHAGGDRRRIEVSDGRDAEVSGGRDAGISDDGDAGKRAGSGKGPQS